ncbi:DNA-directed RNA polymerase I subunit RPA43 isoform X2 [Xiphophorus hellerii]|uniref:DNA-directed RNA polymerase I subunit RPA43 isoform X2 n=1 Tax=Xiphophorus hellerii TaxID=8084 RepID=UPI0013B427DF|nr:DNA-directed RNA polymerase I subunit RPA43 isoform X2 [Xiphophorus hellerii]
MANLDHAEDDRNHVKMPGELPAAGSPVNPNQGSRSPGETAGTIPSFAAASELLSAPYSCLVLNTHRRHVALPPVYLNKKRTGIQEELDAELLKFSQSLHGVPLAYDNIRIATQHGDIYDDSGYIHMNIEANFIVFQPKKGQKLLGKVNKLGVSHVGCLVHGCFNASIPKPNLVSVETWRDSGPRIGTELEFKVTTLDADTAGVLLIRGQLDRTRVQELMAMSENLESSVPAGQEELQEAEPAPEPQEAELAPEPQEAEPELTHDGTPKKKKKKKKEKERIKEEETEEQITKTPHCLNGSTEQTNSSDTPEKKKKKKKEKHMKEEEEQMEVSAIENHRGFGDNVSKKRKLESGTDAPSGDDVTPKKSKKKKKKSDI